MSDNRDLLMESCMQRSMIINIPDKDWEKIVTRQKTVIVQRKCPDVDTIRWSWKIQHQPIVYLYNESRGVFAESRCEITMPNSWIGISNSDYKQNPKKYFREETILNEKVNLDGTCMTMREFRDYVQLGKHCYFTIKELMVYEVSLPIDAFYIGRVGKNGIFAPYEKFIQPRGWCYALKK